MGALACVASPTGARVRRALARDGDRFLLRADRAPFDDGWHRVLGWVEPDALDRLAALAPASWCALRWELATARASLRAPRAPRSRARVAVSPLGARHHAAWEGLHRGAALPRLDDGVPFARVVMGAWVDGALVGAVFLTRDGDDGWVSGLRVARAQRGRGVAGALLAAVSDLAPRWGLASLRAYVHPHNAPSRRAFASAGYAPAGRWWSDPHDPFAAAERAWEELSRLSP